MIKRWVKNKLYNWLISSLDEMEDELKASLFLKYKIVAQKKTYDLFRKKYEIDQSFRFNGNEILFYGNGKIKCGSNSYIGNYSTIQTADNCYVTIGNNCAISHNVRIYTTTNDPNQNFDKLVPKEKYSKNVIICNGVWIGANVFINPGIIIGENAIIGANSVLTKDIEANAIYGGVPAKLIRYKN